MHVSFMLLTLQPGFSVINETHGNILVEVLGGIVAMAWCSF